MIADGFGVLGGEDAAAEQDFGIVEACRRARFGEGSGDVHAALRQLHYGGAECFHIFKVALPGHSVSVDDNGGHFGPARRVNNIECHNRAQLPK
jgi:hypothetical protein